MNLRERAEGMATPRTGPRSKIDRLVVAHPDDEDDIKDLLLGSPRIAHTIVADTLTDAYTPPVRITDHDVSHWRKVNR